MFHFCCNNSQNGTVGHQRWAVVSTGRIDINQATPKVIFTKNINLKTIRVVSITGIIAGTFANVCGIACYINDEPINLSPDGNSCHPDCGLVRYGGGSDNAVCLTPFAFRTDKMSPGSHKVEVAAIRGWWRNYELLVINDRVNNDMGSSSSMIIETTDDEE